MDSLLYCSLVVSCLCVSISWGLMCFHIGLCCVPTQLVTDVYVGGLVNGEGNQSLVLNEGDTLTLKWFQAGPHGRGLWC